MQKTKGNPSQVQAANHFSDELAYTMLTKTSENPKQGRLSKEDDGLHSLLEYLLQYQ